MKALNISGRIMDFSEPKIMAIVNLTSDSFYTNSRFGDSKHVVQYIESALEQGADIIDIGAMSSRPGAKEIPLQEEKIKIVNILSEVRNVYKDIIISVDTYRSEVAKAAADMGADIINDISGGTLDASLWDTMAELKLPYILMHIQGSPVDMQLNPHYNDVVYEVLSGLIQNVRILRNKGLSQIIVDPGFGFGKTIDHNYKLLDKLNVFDILDLPIMVGISRKSMIYKPINSNPDHALNGTSALHMIALERGASILRVHDVKEARECIELHTLLKRSRIK